jgi:hypothetical protein
VALVVTDLYDGTAIDDVDGWMVRVWMSLILESKVYDMLSFGLQFSIMCGATGMTSTDEAVAAMLG